MPGTCPGVFGQDTGQGVPGGALQCSRGAWLQDSEGETAGRREGLSLCPCTGVWFAGCTLSQSPATGVAPHSCSLLSALCRVVEASTLQQERLQAIAVSPCSASPCPQAITCSIRGRHQRGGGRRCSATGRGSLMRTQNGPCQCVPVGAPPGVSEPAWLDCTLETGTEQATGS